MKGIVCLFRVPCLSGVLLSMNSVLKKQVGTLVCFCVTSSRFKIDTNVAVNCVRETVSFVLLTLCCRGDEGSFARICIGVFFVCIFVCLCYSRFSVVARHIPLLFILSCAVVCPRVFTYFADLGAGECFLMMFILCSMLGLTRSGGRVFSECSGLLFNVRGCRRERGVLERFVSGSR